MLGGNNAYPGFKIRIFKIIKNIDNNARDFLSKFPFQSRDQHTQFAKDSHSMQELLLLYDRVRVSYHRSGLWTKNTAFWARDRGTKKGAVRLRP